MTTYNTFSPAAVQAQGRLLVFVVRSGFDAALDGLSLAQGAEAWGDAIALGGLHTSPAVAIRNADGRVEIFARGSNNALYHCWETTPGGKFSAWQSLDGVLTGYPAVGRNVDGRLEVFARGTGNALYHRWQTSPGGSWSDWAPLGGNVAIDAPAIISAANGHSRIEVFVRGMDNKLYRIAQQSGGWGAWTDLGGNHTGPVVVGRNADGRLEAFARGSDAALYHIWETTPSGSFNTWQTLGGYHTSGIALGRNGDGRLEVFARGTTDELYHCWQVPGVSAGWSAWASFGGDVAGDPSVVTDSEGFLHVFVTGKNNQLLTIRQTTAWTWSDFEPVDSRPPVRPVDTFCWMSDLDAFIGTRKLREITLPGTHDSGAYEFVSTELDQYNRGEWDALYDRIADSIVDDIIRYLSRTQSKTIYEQLAGGIRYLDIRAMVSRVDHQWHMYHGRVAHSVAVCLDDIVRFLGELDNRGKHGEVVIVSFGNLEAFAENTIGNLATAIATRLDPWLYKGGAYAEKSIREICAGSNRVIVLFDDAATYNANFFSGASISVDTNGDDILDSTRRSIASFSNPNHLLVRLPWTREPGRSNVISTVLDLIVESLNPVNWFTGFDYEKYGLHKMALETNGMLGNAIVGHGERITGFRFNIITVDFFDESPVVAACIALSLLQPGATQRRVFLAADNAFTMRSDNGFLVADGPLPPPYKSMPDGKGFEAIDLPEKQVLYMDVASFWSWIPASDRNAIVRNVNVDGPSLSGVFHRFELPQVALRLGYTGKFLSRASHGGTFDPIEVSKSIADGLSFFTPRYRRVTEGGSTYDLVAFQADDGRWLSRIQRDGLHPIEVSKSTPDEYCWFRVQPYSGTNPNLIMLKADNGAMVRMVMRNNVPVLEALGPELHVNCLLAICKLVQLRARNGNYLKRVNRGDGFNPIEAATPTPDAFSTFVEVPVVDEDLGTFQVW